MPLHRGLFRRRPLTGCSPAPPRRIRCPQTLSLRSAKHQGAPRRGRRPRRTPRTCARLSARPASRPARAPLPQPPLARLPPSSRAAALRRCGHRPLVSPPIIGHLRHSCGNGSHNLLGRQFAIKVWSSPVAACALCKARRSE